MTRLWFICAGNICRSPLAEAFFRRESARAGLPAIEIASAGLIASPGDRSLPKTLRAAEACGLDLAGHRAQRFDPVAVAAADLVLVMERSQREAVQAATGLGPSAVLLLGELASGWPAEIADPEDGPEEAFDACAGHLAAGVAELVCRLAAGELGAEPERA